MLSVGFAGLGRMGAQMAINIANAGFPIAVWNRNADKAADVVKQTGALLRESPQQLAENSTVVITMLADDEASAVVHQGAEGTLAAATGADYIIEMGTHSPAHIRQLAERAGPRRVIDAPVSGSIDAATNAQLLIMAGADSETIEPIADVLAAMSREIVCFGVVGAGATMKLAVNMLIHGLNQTVAESLSLAEAAGIAPANAYQAIESSAAAAPMLHYRKPQYLDESGSPVAFALDLAHKDVTLAVELATELGVGLPQTSVNLSQLAAAQAAGFGNRDMASILNYLRETS